MRIRVSGRFIALLAILAAFLCLLPASSKVAVAKPIGWQDVGPSGPGPTGDNDGVVLKGMSAASPTVAAAGTGNVAARSTARQQLSGVRLLFAMLRLNWSFWLR